MREIGEANQAALEELERQRAEQEYLADMQPAAERREWQLPTPEPPPRRRGLDTRPAPAVDWNGEIRRQVADARAYLLEVLAETVAELAERQREAIDDALRPLRLELCELRIRCGELKLSNTELREQLTASGQLVTDLPNPLRSRAN